MKIRTGFISNSSSSSFIVAFSKKPKTKDDVLKEMFPNDPMGTVPNPWPSQTECGDGLSHSQIVEQVFSDLQTKSKKVSKKDFLDELAGRYFVMNNKLYYTGAPYYASDAKLAQQYVDAHKANETAHKEFDTFERELIRKHVGPDVPYAYEGSTNWNTHQPYTKAEIEAYKTYTDAIKAFKEANPKYIAAKKKYSQQERKVWDTQCTLTNKLARIDLKKFMEDNKGKFITRFTYSDNDGQFFSLMEHSGVFNTLNHIPISHH